MEKMDDVDKMEDVDKIKGNNRKGDYRTRILWGCACSYLLPAILLIVYIIVRWRYGMPIIPFIR
jgi:hypothetical protein